MRPSRIEALVAVTGPIVTLAFAVACLLASHWLPNNMAWLSGVPSIQGWFNVLGVVMNGLPILPTDGGRVLRALPAGRMADHYRATRLASNIGVATALALASLAIPMGLLVNPWLSLPIAWAALSLIPGAWRQRFHPGTFLVDEDPSKRG